MNNTDKFEHDTTAFLSWLKDTAALKISSKIEVADLRKSNEGRCILATEDIAKDDILFEIPQISLLNTKTSQLVKDNESISRSIEELGEWEGLITCLFYEWKVLKDKSFWWPYLNVLPEANSLNGLMYWENNELDHLKPSLVLDRIGTDGAKKMFDSIISFIEENKLGSTFGEVSWDNFLQVASIIMAYSFDVTNDEEDEDGEDDEEIEVSSIKSMVPFADTLNADTYKCNANLIYDEDSLKMCAIKPIKKGEQVYNIYGEHPNSEILRRYGYVEWDGSAFDFGEVLLSDIIEALSKTFNKNEDLIKKCIELLQGDEIVEELLDDQSIVLQSYDCYQNGEIITEVVVLLQILCIMLQIPAVDGLSVADLQKEIKRVTKKCTQLIEGGRITESCKIIWPKIILVRLEAYPSGIFDKDINVTKITDIKKLRKAMSETVLKCEYNALKKCLSSFEKQFKIIEDKKLLNNILKRKLDGNDTKKTVNKKSRN